jgi:hypothetical protein
MLRRAVAALLLAFIALAPAGAAERVTVRAAEHDKEGFGRIAFDWPAPVTFEAKIEGETLTVHFARPLEAKLDAVVRHLEGYVGAVQIGDDGTSLIATLKRPARVRSFIEGTRTVAVDIVTSPPAAAPVKKLGKATPAPAPAAPLPAAAAPALLPAPIAVEPPPGLVDASTASAPSEPTPSAPTPSEPASAPPAPASKPVAATPSPAVTVSVGEHEGDRHLVLDWHAPVHYLFNHTPGGAQFRFAHPIALDMAQLEAALPDLSPHLGEEGGKTVLRFTLPQGTRLQASHTTSTIAVDVTGKRLRAASAAPPSAAPPPAAPPPPSAAKAPDAIVPPPELVEPTSPRPAPTKPDGSRAAKRPTAALPPPTGSLPVHYVLAPQGASLRFDFAKPPAAAVFRRGSSLWIVFSGARLLDLSEPRHALGDVIQRIEQLPDARAAVLRLVTREGINPSLRRIDDGWVIELKPQEAHADAPIAMEARPSADSSEIFLGVHDAADPLSLRDPEVGDVLTVVPVGDVGRGIAEPQSFVDVAALPSVQGIVLRPNADDLEVRSAGDGVRLTRPGGLLLSQAGDRKLAEAAKGPPRMLDFEAWRGPADEGYIEKRSQLERVVAAAPAALRSKPRLALARFYFANLYAAEAQGVLEAIRRDDPAALADAPQVLLSGAVALLDGDQKAAAQLLGQDGLANEPEAQLWRASLAAGLGDWPAAAKGFTAASSVLPRYPTTLRRRFALEAAEALIEAGEAAEAAPMIQLVLKSDPSVHDKAEATFLDGRRQLAEGDEKQAIATWDKVAGMDDRLARARAGFAKTMAELETKDISRADAIKALDGLRFAWRGDALEFDLLRRLGELKLADGDPRGAFDALRAAAGDFPDNPQAKDVTKQLSDDVAEMFLGRSLDDLPPLKALTLYDEFKDYLPSGERGDAVVRRLVDRLVAVDLLDRAAGLLEDQVTHRLAGNEKARVAGQLAVIRLLDNRPADALKALDIEVGKDLPPDMARQRQQLRARALTELKRSDDALAILANDNSRDADRLRADIFWRAREWSEAAKVLARLAPPPPGAETLDRAGAQIVLNWASALTLAGDQLGLSDLRSGYGKAMAATPFADAFRVVADDPAAIGEGDPRTVANRVAQVGELQSFIAGLKEKVAKDKLSAVN